MQSIGRDFSSIPVSTALLIGCIPTDSKSYLHKLLSFLHHVEKSISTLHGDLLLLWLLNAAYPKGIMHHIVLVSKKAL